MHCGGLAENIYLLTVNVYPSLFFEILHQTKCLKETEGFVLNTV